MSRWTSVTGREGRPGRRAGGVPAPARLRRLPAGGSGGCREPGCTAAKTHARVSAEVLDAREDAGAIELALEGRARSPATGSYSALGNLPGAPIGVLGSDPRIIPDPWAAGAVKTPQEGRTLVVGMGLTAVDTILSLTADDDDAAVLALSPSGRFPFAHLSGEHTPSPAPAIPEGSIGLDEAEKLVRDHIARMESEGYDWRDAFDGLRPVTSELWSRLSVADRREFLQRHVREWERRRHRMAPAVAERLAQLASTGRLTTLAARLSGVDGAGPRLRVTVDLGGGRDSRQLDCERIIVCAGPGTDIRRSPSRLLQSLLQSGRVVPDDLGLGLRASGDGALLDDQGREGDGRIFTLGPCGAESCGRRRPWVRSESRHATWRPCSTARSQVSVLRFARRRESAAPSCSAAPMPWPVAPATGALGRALNGRIPAQPCARCASISVREPDQTRVCRGDRLTQPPDGRRRCMRAPRAVARMPGPGCCSGRGHDPRACSS